MITIKIKIKEPTKCKKRLLCQYSKDFSSCVNWFLRKLEQEKTTNRISINKLYYHQARLKFKVSSANIQFALDKAIGIKRSFLRKKKRKKSKLQPKLHKEISCFRKDSIKIKNNCARLTLVDKILWLPLNIPKKHLKFLNRPIVCAEIKNIKKAWYLYLTIKNSSKLIKNRSKILGIDLGIAKIATVSNLENSVNVFFRGEEIRFKKQQSLKKRKILQTKKARKECPGAWRVLKKLSGKEKRKSRDLNHKISRTIVNIAIKNDSAIAMENLSGIRTRIKSGKKIRRMINSWSFKQLSDFIEYKARLTGIPFVTVDPRKTSRICLKCGNENKQNRKSQSSFKCTKCGYSINADLLAARNIALRATSQLARPFENAGLDTPPMQSTATRNSL